MNTLSHIIAIVWLCAVAPAMGFIINPFRFVVAGGGSDPYFSSVSLLAHCNGANNSTTLTDSSPAANTFTANAAAKITTSQSVFGGASSEYDGSRSYFSCPDSSAFDFGSGNFTIEFRLRRTNSAATQIPLGQWAISSAKSWLIEIDSNDCNFYYSTNGTSHNGAKLIGTISNNTWYSVAVSRVGNNLYTFLNGTLTTTVDVTGVTLYNSAGSVLVGGFIDNYSYDFYGQIDEVRITKGTGRYSASYTIDASAFPDS